MVISLHFPVATTALIAAVIGAGLVALVRKGVALHLLTSHHEVAFPIFLQIGVIYAVLLAFIFSMMLDHINEAYTKVKIESTNLLTLAQLAPAFAPETRSKIDQILIEYTQIVINKEWPKMSKQQEEPEASKILGVLQNIYLNISPKTVREQIVYASSLEHLAQLRENRRMRIFTATEPRLATPLVLLSALGLIVIAISYFFGMHRLWAQMILTGALIFTITSILVVIFFLATPFSGRLSIHAKIFENTLVRLEQIAQEH